MYVVLFYLVYQHTRLTIAHTHYVRHTFDSPRKKKSHTPPIKLRYVLLDNKSPRIFFFFFFFLKNPLYKQC